MYSDETWESLTIWVKKRILFVFSGFPRAFSCAQPSLLLRQPYSWLPTPWDNFRNLHFRIWIFACECPAYWILRRFFSCLCSNCSASYSWLKLTNKICWRVQSFFKFFVLVYWNSGRFGVLWLTDFEILSTAKEGVTLGSKVTSWVVNSTYYYLPIPICAYLPNRCWSRLNSIWALQIDRWNSTRS